MIRRVLVANRGEIAARVIRTCARLGIETVLAASEADADSVPARLANEVRVIGPAPAAQSYLDVDRIVASARQGQVDAVHPGYGFLSENARLAAACEAAGLVFIGPTPAQLAALGDKLEARRHAAAAGLPVVPGGSVETFDDARRVAREIGMPLLIKAVGGGGGRGMRLVREAGELEDAVGTAMAEAAAAFGDARIYIERYVEQGRHVEIQVLGDGREVIHLGTRDCSIQRRYQKLIEEAPAPALPDAMREGLHRGAVELGRHLGYRGLGTVECLVDLERERCYFLEMNARIQVEHPVTEAITGLDLVAEQIAVAGGGRLPLAQAEVAFAGHAIECRINAEDPEHDFRPSPGTVRAAWWPVGPGVRVDTHVVSGTVVPPHYDSLVGKVIATGDDRDAALRRMRAALGRLRLDGIQCNAALHAEVMADPEFARGGVDTGYFPAFLARRAEIEELSDGPD